MMVLGDNGNGNRVLGACRRRNEGPAYIPILKDSLSIV